MESHYEPLLPICSDCPNKKLRVLDILYAYDDMEAWRSEARARETIQGDPCVKPIGEVAEVCSLPRVEAIVAILQGGIEIADYQKE